MGLWAFARHLVDGQGCIRDFPSDQNTLVLSSEPDDGDSANGDRDRTSLPRPGRDPLAEEARDYVINPYELEGDC